ncbi:MAG TPA: glycosyltransferase family 4 protein [Candidatus Angelobacter sp.]|jgi:glycosyltransferase involved in cell wall biosynthesis|nr:glycosyltransferase family 4 protein [Candidatus Angelobacter sp.]
MRLTLVIPSMERGGAERVMSILASSWAEKGHQVTLLTLRREVNPAYELHPSVKFRNLGLTGEPAANSLLAAFRQVARLRALRRAIRESQPGLVISFMERTNVLTLVATRGLRIPVIVSERVDPRHYDIGRLWHGLRSLAYRWAGALVCQSRTSLMWFEQRMKVKGCVIPNPVLAFKEGTARLPLKDPEGRTIVAMGRLVDQKGFDLLLDAFGQLSARYPDWSLVVLGEGPLRGELQARASALHLEHQVQFAGEVPDPFPVLRAADLFVLSSRFEGFPNALCEAMACGVAVVSFNCPSGPAEIVRHGVDGILVPPADVSALVAALDSLMKDQHERDRLASRAPEVVERFSRDKVLLLWEQLFEEVNSSGR